MAQTTLKQFDQPDELREFPNGRFEIVHLAGVSLGRATYQPGWKWSLHNAPLVGTALCHAPHTGVVLAGHGVVVMSNACPGKRPNCHAGWMTLNSTLCQGIR